MSRERDTTNPWGLTVLETTVAAAYVEHGEHEKAALALGKGARSIGNALDRIARKMGVASRVQLVAKWVEWSSRKYANQPRTAWVCPRCEGMGFLARRPG